MTATASAPGGLCFDFNREQKMLRKMVRDFVERECPKPVARELQFAFALTEPEGGTDVLRAMRTRAERAEGAGSSTGPRSGRRCRMSPTA